MRERRPLFGYGLQRSGMSAVYHSVCERVDFSIRFDMLWHSCGISTRQWKGYMSHTCMCICVITQQTQYARLMWGLNPGPGTPAYIQYQACFRSIKIYH